MIEYVLSSDSWGDPIAGALGKRPRQTQTDGATAPQAPDYYHPAVSDPPSRLLSTVRHHPVARMRRVQFSSEGYPDPQWLDSFKAVPGMETGHNGAIILLVRQWQVASKSACRNSKMPTASWQNGQRLDWPLPYGASLPVCARLALRRALYPEVRSPIEWPCCGRPAPWHSESASA